MIEPSTAPRARLFTIWGTVLYVDVASGELRHGPIDSSPANTFFEADMGSTNAGRCGSIVYGSAEAPEPIVCLADCCLLLSTIEGEAPAAMTATLLELVPLERGLIALRAAGAFLCAQPDGRLTLANTVCSTWECFLASEDWCGAAAVTDDVQLEGPTKLDIDRKGIAKFIVDARLRAKVNASSKATKVLIYGYPAWSHGRVYYDVCKHLYSKGYIVDIINWQVDHTTYIGELVSYYDFFLSALNEVHRLIEFYGVPCERIIALSHGEMDIRMLIDRMGTGIFEKFAGYGAVSYPLFTASVISEVPRHPFVVQLGVNFEEFHADIPERLTTVGYAGSMSLKTIEGFEIKRGELAEAAAHEAGLAFKVAGSTAQQISFHDMPEFYRSVDAILVSSVSEGAQLPVREAAAAGRLLISTPVGDFPMRAAQGIGIIAPIESHKYRKFVATTLKYYKENPAAFIEICRETQTAARQLDWLNVIGDWVELIETAKAYPLELARAHQQAGRLAEAAALFSSQAERGGNAEQKWYARWQYALCIRELGDEKGFVREALAAFRERPHRAEPLVDLANYYLIKQQAVPAAFYAEAVLAIPLPENDVLSVNPDLYETGLHHTFAAIASWSPDPEQKERGRKVCDWLALNRDVPEYIRGPARYNSGWYAVSAQSLLPSLQFHPLSVVAPEGFRVANVAICQYGDGFAITARAVNYVLSPDGYHDKEDANEPYRSRVLLLNLDRELRITASKEAELPEDLPAQSFAALGFEDPRPFVWRNQLWCVAATRQLNPEARAEMVLARIEEGHPGRCFLADWRVLPSGLPTQWEKNWMPQVVGEELRFICTVDPTRVLTEAGVVLRNEPASVAAEDFRGGSQAVPFDDGWLMVIHQAEVVNHKRRYLHRFIWFDGDNAFRSLSCRFYLRQVGYEFVAGMTWHADSDRIVISFSVHDAEPCLAIVAAADVRAALMDIDDLRPASDEAVAAGRSALRKIIGRSNRGGKEVPPPSAKRGGTAPVAATPDADEDERRWHAEWQDARFLREMGDEEGFVRAALNAFRERPQRAEPLYDLAQHFLAKQRVEPAAFYAEAALAIPRPEHDVLSVDFDLYETGLRHTFAAIASWSQNPEQKERGRKVCDWLALSRDVPEYVRGPASYNSGWYAVPAQSLLPSLQFHPLSIELPEGTHAVNSAICGFDDKFFVIVRSGNWILTGADQYVCAEDQWKGSLTLLAVGQDLTVISVQTLTHRGDTDSLEYLMETSVGDPRPFKWRGELWCVSSTHQIPPRAWVTQMVLAQVNQVGPGRAELSAARVIPSGMEPRWEKNWMPQIRGDELRFIYSVDPTRILTSSGAVLYEETPPIFAEKFRGGSQAIAFDGGWLMVIHEVDHVNGMRRYFHRFICIDNDNRVFRLSRRFYLRQLGIEFVSGMAWHPDGERLVLSFSERDTEQSLVTIHVNDVRDILLDVAEHEQASREAVAATHHVLEYLLARREGDLFKIFSKDFNSEEYLSDGTIVESVIDSQRVKFFVTNPHDEVMKYHSRG